jgi:hypothetical protein
MTRRFMGVGMLAVIGLMTATVGAQSFRVQCPATTLTHPGANESEPPYNGATVFNNANSSDNNAYLTPQTNINGAIKCQQISGGDGYATMADGTQTYMFSFGPLSGLTDIAKGLPGTQFPGVFNTPYGGASPLVPGDPATSGLTDYNGAVGIAPDIDNNGAMDGHVDARQIMDVAVMNGNIPAPLMAIDEDDEFFLTLTNVGMIMRPDLFEQHTVHFHGYPNASAFYDGVPDASVAINIGGSFTYYYLAPDAGTYFWHCHITPPEHLQMGMVGQIYVRPRQNRVPTGTSLYAALQKQQGDLRTACNPAADIVCTNSLPPADNLTDGGYVQDLTGPQCTAGVKPPNCNPNYGTWSVTKMFAYNDGDGSTAYDVEYPLQIHGFDPNFHFVGMTFNPEGFADMKDKYFLLNGRSYPDTVYSGSKDTPTSQAMQTQSADGASHFSQPLSANINIPAGGKALLRISDLDVSEYQTLASLGIPMHVIGYNAKLLRDQDGNNMYYDTNSITLGGGESLDLILDATGYTAPQTFYLYTPNLDHLANDAENFGGLMTEVHICNSVDPQTKACN